MSKDKQPAANFLEDELARLSPEPLDEALLHRLECCAVGDWTELTTEERCFESAARNFAPAPLDERQLERFAAVLDGVKFGGSGKVTTFPVAPAAAKRKAGAAWWSAAAAVAILGASVAFLVPGERKANGVATNRMVPAPASPVAAGALVPASFDRNLDAVSDQGVVWSKDKRPHRVVKVAYVEKLRATTPDGRVVEVEQPRVQHILVPVSGD